MYLNNHKNHYVNLYLLVNNHKDHCVNMDLDNHKDHCANVYLNNHKGHCVNMYINNHKDHCVNMYINNHKDHCVHMYLNNQPTKYLFFPEVTAVVLLVVVEDPVEIVDLLLTNTVTSRRLRLHVCLPV